MKLFAGIIAVAAATCTPPNDSWVDSSGVCAPDGVTVTCTATEMTVLFDAGHLYVAMDSSHADGATSTSTVGSCTTAETTSASGVYTTTFALDDCDTTVTQAAGIIEFSNTITGNVAAVSVDGIITTELLSLDVSCTFDDSLTISVDDIAVSAGTHVLDGSTATGLFTGEFTLASFSDAIYNTLSSAAAPVVIGDPIYNRVSVSGSLPTNVEFVVTSCRAMDSADGTGATFTVLDDGCLDDLVAATASSLTGDVSTDVDFSFNGFTFASTSDLLYLECTIELCAIDSSGDFIDATCGYLYGGDACAAISAAKTMGMSAAPALV